MTETGESERLVAARRRMLLWYLPGTAVFFASIALRYAFPAWARTPVGMGFPLFSGAAFFVAMAMLTLLMVKIRRVKPEVVQAFNDERVEQARLLGWRDAFWAVLISEGVWVGVLAVWPQLVPPSVVAVVTMAVACLVSVGSFLWRDRE